MSPSFFIANNTPFRLRLQTLCLILHDATDTHELLTSLSCARNAHATNSIRLVSQVGPLCLFPSEDSRLVHKLIVFSLDPWPLFYVVQDRLINSRLANHLLRTDHSQTDSNTLVSDSVSVCFHRQQQTCTQAYFFFSVLYALCHPCATVDTKPLISLSRDHNAHTTSSARHASHLELLCVSPSLTAESYTYLLLTLCTTSLL